MIKKMKISKEEATKIPSRKNRWNRVLSKRSIIITVSFEALLLIIRSELGVVVRINFGQICNKRILTYF